MDLAETHGSSTVSSVPLSELAWPPNEPQTVVTPVHTPHGLVLVTFEYFAEANGSYPTPETENGTSEPQFSPSICGDQAVLPCIGVLDPALGSVYDIGKSVIVAGQTTSDVTSPRRLTSSDASLNPPHTFIPTNPPTSSSVITCAQPVLSPTDREDPTGSHLDLGDGETSANTVPNSVFLRSIAMGDVIVNPSSAADDVTISIVTGDSRTDGVICPSPDSVLQTDFQNNSPHTVNMDADPLLADESNEILMASANSELDRMELVIGNQDTIGFTYALESNMVNVANVFSFRHLLDANSLADAEGDIQLRRDSVSPDDLSRPGPADRQDDFNILDVHQVPLVPLEGNNSTMKELSLPAIAPVDDRKDSTPAATSKPVVQHHRPALAEKTFKMDNNSVTSKDVTKKKLSPCIDDCSECLDGDCFRHVVQAISDKPVPSRAWASLPGVYLAVNHTFDTRCGVQATGVFARKMIPKCTQFGPMEGVVVKADAIQTPDERKLKLLIENKTGTMVGLDISDENTSNWMRFVRPAQDCREQNVVLSQHDNALYFTTTRDISPRQELLVWYSQAYAARRGLKLLEPSEPWTCFKCNETFTNSVDIQKHLNVHASEQNENDDSPQIKCGRWSQPVKKKGVLHFAVKKLKLGTERNQGSPPHQCTTCKRTFPRNYSLKRHLMMHVRERRHTCPKCSTKFSNAHLKERHMRNVHNIETSDLVGNRNDYDSSKKSCGTWSCTQCALVFHSPDLLQIHALVHPEQSGDEDQMSELLNADELKCPDCLQDFPNEQELAHHVSSHGIHMARRLKRKMDPNKPFRCQQCYKAFASEERLQHHMLVHGSDESKPLQCNICSKRFLTNSALICHVKSHSGGTKLFDCPICKMTFEQSLALRDHVHGHAVNGFFTCPHCNKKFQGYGSTRKHIRAFHNERTQKCHHCDHVFPTVDKLRMHMLRHSDHREFLCANCGKQFKRKDKLKEHMARMHSTEREMMAAGKSSGTQDGGILGNKAVVGDKIKKKKRKAVAKIKSEGLSDYERYVFKCHPCLQGFKRRGMLVNHLAKRHPDVVPDQVPELNLPILRTTRDYFCQYCEKVYKSSSKRKAHILKNHPGADLPSDGRQKSSGRTYMFSQSVGTEPTAPHRCQWCYKQYATKAKLLQHQRSVHKELLTEPVKKIRQGEKPKGKKDSVQNPAISTTSSAVKDALLELKSSGLSNSSTSEYSISTAMDSSVSSSDSSKGTKAASAIDVVDTEGVEVSENMLTEAMQYLAATGNLHILGHSSPSYPAR